jgi:hypothetical protein
MIEASLFWTKVAAIGQVAGAVATFLAVIVALYLGRAQQRFQLKVKAHFGQIVDVRGATPVMTIEVENTGLRTVRITGFGWSTGFTNTIRALPKWLRLQSAFQMPDYTWAINPPFPWILEPGEAKSTHIRRQDFIDGFSEPAPEDLFRRLPWASRKRLFRHRVWVGVYTRPTVWFGVVDPKITDALNKSYRGNENR